MHTTEHFSENKTKNTMKLIAANNELDKSQNAKWKKKPNAQRVPDTWFYLYTILENAS